MNKPILLYTPTYTLHVSAPRWTPPIPPVTNTGIPAALAKIIVPATVVAPTFF
jgi:hypothetical protein